MQLTPSTRIVSISSEILSTFVINYKPPCPLSSQNISANSPPGNTTVSCRHARPSSSSNSTSRTRCRTPLTRRALFMWMEDGGRVVAFLRIIPAGIAYAEPSVGRVLVDAAYRRRGLCRSLMSEALSLYCPDMGPPAHPHLGTRAPGRILRHPRVRTGLGHLFRSRYPARQKCSARRPGTRVKKFRRREVSPRRRNHTYINGSPRPSLRGCACI